MRVVPYLLFLLLTTSCAFAQQERFCRIGDSPETLYGLKRLWNPEYFQGYSKTKSYFEGWYFKMVSANGKHRYAFIPGVSLGDDSHSFVQVIDGTTGSTQYYRFPIEEFYYSTNRFAVWVGPNFFSADSFFVDLGAGENLIIGKGLILNRVEYPIKPLMPGIMGWYRFVPFMECFHGIVSIDHTLLGDFLVGSQIISFTGGKGYIEKDWGKSMPSAWVWTQSNNFSNSPNASFMLSVANIPWMGRSFTGFLGYLYANGNLYRFATYTGAKIKVFETEGDKVRVVIESRKFTIEFIGVKGTRGNLLAPVAGEMSRTIHESIDAIISVKLTDNEGLVLFEGEAPIAGLELVGDTNALNPNKQ